MTSLPICAHEDFERGGNLKWYQTQLKIYNENNDPLGGASSAI